MSLYCPPPLLVDSAAPGGSPASSSPPPGTVPKPLLAPDAILRQCPPGRFHLGLHTTLRSISLKLNPLRHKTAKEKAVSTPHFLPLRFLHILKPWSHLCGCRSLAHPAAAAGQEGGARPSPAAQAPHHSWNGHRTSLPDASSAALDLLPHTGGLWLLTATPSRLNSPSWLPRSPQTRPHDSYHAARKPGEARPAVVITLPSEEGPTPSRTPR